MRGKELFEKLTDIDEKIVTQAENYKKVKKFPYQKWIASAACLAVIVSAVAVYHNNTPMNPSTPSPFDPTLPMLEIATDFGGGGMGFEGYWAYDITDLTNANPWNEDMELTHLPVITNQFVLNEATQRIESPDYEQMEALLIQTALTLGMDVANLPITNDMPDAEYQQSVMDSIEFPNDEVPDGYFSISTLYIEDDNYQVKVDWTCDARIHIKSPVTLPSEYNLSFYTTYEEALLVAEYLQTEYEWLIAMEHPTINISGGDFNIHADQGYDISFFDEADDDIQTILNYHFNTVSFSSSHDGKLSTVWMSHADLSDVIGLYPIINADEALRLLENGTYITNVPQEFKGSEYVKKVELVYRPDESEKIFMPYYRFYVELPEEERTHDLNTYGAYYVPAVERQYIKNMPMWDGGFN